MYWDMLTATGLLVSIVSNLSAFYLVLRERPVVRRDDPGEMLPAGLDNRDWQHAC